MIISDLAGFWRSASLPVPLVIVGGGRWGRTWLSAVVAARGSAEGVVLAARSRPDDVRTWAKARAELAGLRVVTSLVEAMAIDRPPRAAIISSRPRDHVRDGIEAFSHGLHALVEKPLSVDSESGRPLLAAAERAKRVLAVGTEFAFLPAFHQLAEELATAGRIDLSLIWDDVEGEERYGATKIRHKETDLLCDLLPHAFSILRIFVPNVALRISAAHRTADGCQGRLEFRDDRGGQHELRCDSRAKARRRILNVRTASARASVDFSGPHSVMTIDGQSRALHQPLSAMTSTLRLELGAFLSQATGATNAAFTGWDASALLSVQADLERALASGAS